jgi:hypothetical protein
LDLAVGERGRDGGENAETVQVVRRRARADVIVLILTMCIGGMMNERVY